MTNAEKDILGQIAGDVTEIKVTLGRVETRVTVLQETTLDHESRLRNLERTAISKTGVVPIMSIILLTIGVIAAWFHK